MSSFFFSKLISETAKLQWLDIASGNYNFKNADAYFRLYRPEDTIFTYNLLVFPVNLCKNHWILVVVDLREKVVSFYDSLKVYTGRLLQRCFEYIARYLCEKSKQDDAWKMTVPDMLQQTNSYDCGVYTCVSAAYVVSGKADLLLKSSASTFPANFGNRFRRHMIVQFLKMPLPMPSVPCGPTVSREDEDGAIHCDSD